MKTWNQVKFFLKVFRREFDKFFTPKPPEKEKRKTGWRAKSSLTR